MDVWHIGRRWILLLPVLGMLTLDSDHAEGEAVSNGLHSLGFAQLQAFQLTYIIFGHFFQKLFAVLRIHLHSKRKTLNKSLFTFNPLTTLATNTGYYG